MKEKYFQKLLSVQETPHPKKEMPPFFKLGHKSNISILTNFDHL